MRTTLLPLLILILATSCGNSANADQVGERLAQANVQIEKQNFAKAEGIYLTILKQDVDNINAQLGLAKIARYKGEYGKSLNILKEIIEKKSDLLEAYTLTGEIYLAQANLEKALSVKADLLKIAPDAVETLVYQANIALFSGDEEAAHNFALNALNIDPNNASAASLSAKKYFDEENYAQALDIIETSLQKNKENINLSFLRIRILVAQGLTQKVETAYNELINLHPDNINVYRSFIRFYVSNGERKKVAGVIKQVSINEAININSKLGFVEYLNSLGFEQEATDFILSAKNIHSNSPALDLYLANQYALTNKLKEAEAEYRNLIQSKSSSDTPDVIAIRQQATVEYAKLKLKQGDTTGAKALISQVLALTPNSIEALKVRADLHVVENNYPAADADLTEVLRLEPENLSNKLALAANKFSMGNHAKAFSLYRTYLNDHPKDKRFVVNYLHRLIAVDNHQQARITASNWLGANGDQREVLALYAESLIGVKQFDLSLRILERYEAIAGETSFSQFLSAIAYSELGQQSNAIEAFKRSLSQGPSINSARGLLEAYQKAGKVNLAIDYFKDLLNKSDANAPVLYVLGNAYVIDKQYQNAKETYENLINTFPQTPAAYQGLAGVYRVEGNTDQALNILTSGLSKLPNVSLLYREIGLLYIEKEQFDDAITAFKRALELNPADIVVANNYVSLVTDYSNSRANLEALKPLVESLKTIDQTVLNDTIGWFYYRLGNYDEASRLINKAISTSPDEPIYWYHLGMINKAQNQKELAREYLDKSLALADENFSKINEVKIALDSL